MHALIVVDARRRASRDHDLALVGSGVTVDADPRHSMMLAGINP